MSNKKNNKKMKSKIYLFSFMAIVFITVISCVYIQSNKTDMDLSYLEFYEKMEKNEVQSAEYLKDEEFFTGVLKNGQTFKAETPETEDFKKIMLEHKIEVTQKRVINVEIIVTILSTLVMLVFFYFVIGRHFIRANGGETKKKFNPISKIPNVKMEDVAGNEEAKESLMDVVEFLKNPIEFEKYGAKPPKGILLEGVPGVGKTLLGKAIAGESGVNFIAVSGSEFAYKYVGEGADRVKELFKKAREYSPCIIFIDEIDALGKKRGNADSSNQERDSTLNQLLIEMDGFSQSDNIIVIGATNRKDILDSAFRSGRFDRQIQVVPPDLDARIAILKVHSKNKPFAEEIDYNLLGQMTIGMTGADLENMMNTASINAAKAKRENGIILEDITRAFDSIMVGDERKNKKSIRLQDRSVTAYHEAGHCLIAKLHGQKVSKVTINPTTKGVGGYTMISPIENHYETKKEMLQNLQVLVAGRAAEELVFGKDNITNGASNDLEVMTKRISNMLKVFGMGKTYGLLNANIINHDLLIKNEDFLEEMKEVSDNVYQETLKVLTLNRKKLDALANLLLTKETILEKEIDEIIYQ